VFRPHWSNSRTPDLQLRGELPALPVSAGQAVMATERLYGLLDLEVHADDPRLCGERDEIGGGVE